jgi:hypothetical protein
MTLRPGTAILFALLQVSLYAQQPPVLPPGFVQAGPCADASAAGARPTTSTTSGEWFARCSNPRPALRSRKHKLLPWRCRSWSRLRQVALRFRTPRYGR